MLEILLGIGLILIIGFFSGIFFEKTGIPDVLLLMALGVLLGPVLGFVETGKGSIMENSAPLFGAIALTIMLFDGGLNLSIKKVVSGFSKASIFTFIAFAATTIGVAGISHFAFGTSYMEGLLLGAVVGGTSSPIVISTLSKIKLNEETKTVLSLESAFTDALCVISAFALIEIMTSSTASVSGTLKSLAAAFSIAAVFGFLSAIAWAKILRKMEGKAFSYMLTFAVLFSIYALAEIIGGNGAITVLIFGLVLGNIETIGENIMKEKGLQIDPKLKSFHNEISFFIRTFFFVYLGAIFNFKGLSTATLLFSAAVLAVIVAARYFAVRIIGRFDEIFGKNVGILSGTMPRGLAAAVLAGIPVSKGVGFAGFSDIVFLIILGTNIISAGVAFVHSRKSRRSAQKTKVKLK